eukprot:6181937-Pleurochrysis_carterae.AAC.2
MSGRAAAARAASDPGEPAALPHAGRDAALLFWRPSRNETRGAARALAGCAPLPKLRDVGVLL